MRQYWSVFLACIVFPSVILLGGCEESSSESDDEATEVISDSLVGTWSFSSFKLTMVLLDPDDVAAVQEIIQTLSALGISAQLNGNELTATLTVDQFILLADDEFFTSITINADGTWTGTAQGAGESVAGSGTWSTSGNELTIAEPGEMTTFFYEVDSLSLSLWGGEFNETTEEYVLTAVLEFARQ